MFSFLRRPSEQLIRQAIAEQKAVEAESKEIYDIHQRLLGIQQRIERLGKIPPPISEVRRFL